MDITTETIHILLDASRDKEIRELSEANARLRAMLERTRAAIEYRPSNG